MFQAETRHRICTWAVHKSNTGHLEAHKWNSLYIEEPAWELWCNIFVSLLICQIYLLRPLLSGAHQLGLMLTQSVDPEDSMRGKSKILLPTILKKLWSLWGIQSRNIMFARWKSNTQIKADPSRPQWALSNIYERMAKCGVLWHYLCSQQLVTAKTLVPKDLATDWEPGRWRTLSRNRVSSAAQLQITALPGSSCRGQTTYIHRRAW